MTGYHKNLSSAIFDQFSDLDNTLVAEVDVRESVSEQIDIIATQVAAWSEEWKRRAKFLGRKVIPLGVKITLMEMTIKGSRRLCRYEAVLRS